jgi:hypothetical protein
MTPETSKTHLFNMRKAAAPLAAFALLFTFTTPSFSIPLTLTAQGTGLGLTLTKFVSGYDFNGTYGPISQGVASNGKIITGSAGNGKVYVFNDVDNQVLSDAVITNSYACQTGNCNFAMATAGGQVYGAQAFGGIYEHFANNGTFTPIANLQALGLFGNLGMWGNPTNGHLIAGSNKGLVDIDPVAGSYRVINANLAPDGVSVSPDGTLAYLEISGTIQSYSIATGVFLHQYNTGHSPDGTGVVIGGQLNGDVIVNNNDGTLGLLDPSKADGDPNQFIIIATGGSRGDFVSADTNNGTLFISQYEEVARLSCGAGCSIGVAASPEPGTITLVAAGIAVLGFGRRSRRVRG